MIPSATIQHPWPYVVQGGITNKQTMIHYTTNTNFVLIAYYNYRLLHSLIITLIHVNIPLVIQQWMNLNIIYHPNSDDQNHPTMDEFKRTLISSKY